jgi:hypothetical protein
MKTTCKFIQKCFQHIFINDDRWILIKIYMSIVVTLVLGSQPRLKQGKEEMGQEQIKAKKRLKMLKE